MVFTCGWLIILDLLIIREFWWVCDMKSLLPHLVVYNPVWGDPVAILCPKHYTPGRPLCWWLKTTPCFSVFLKFPCFMATFSWTTHFGMYISTLVTILATASVSYKLVTKLHFRSMRTETLRLKIVELETWPLRSEVRTTSDEIETSLMHAYGGTPLVIHIDWSRVVNWTLRERSLDNDPCV